MCLYVLRLYMLNLVIQMMQSHMLAAREANFALSPLMLQLFEHSQKHCFSNTSVMYTP